MEEIKTSRVFWGAAVFAGIFYLVAKVLNIFVFESLFYPILFGFIVGAEAGFWIASSNLTKLVHKETIKFLHHSIIVKNIILFILWFSSLIFGIKIIYDFEILQISFNDGFIVLLAIIFNLLIFICINKIAFERIKSYTVFNNFIYRLAIFPILGFVSIFASYYSSHIPVYISFEKTIYLLYFCLGYIGLVLLFSLIRLAAYSPIASVAMGGVFGAFCGYLIPGWYAWEAKHIIGSMAVSMFAGGCMGVLAHIVGKYSFTKKIFDVLLFKYPCSVKVKE